jgi:hypothetical protein
MSTDKDKIPRVGPLKSAQDCRRELAKIYRLYRQNEVDDRTAKTCCYLLQSLTGIIRDHSFESRLDAIEEKIT